MEVPLPENSIRVSRTKIIMCKIICLLWFNLYTICTLWDTVSVCDHASLVIIGKVAGMLLNITYHFPINIKPLHQLYPGLYMTAR